MAGAAALAMAGTLAGCASASSSGAGTAAVAAARGAGSCGKIPAKPLPADPAHLLAALPRSVQSLYAGFGTAVLPSAWANWKPKHNGKLTVGVSFTALVSPFSAGLYNLVVAQLKRNPAIGKVIAYTAASPQDVAGQIQQFQSLIQQHVDLIVVLAIAGPPFIPAIAQAAKAGIPTISLVNDTPSPYSVNVTPNTWQDIAQPAVSIINAIGRKGSVLLVHGIPGTQADVDEFADFRQVLSACPGVTIAGEVNGMYNPPVTKGAVLQFLSTHPGTISAVFQTATMAPAIIQAFQQAGRPVPPVLDISAQKSSLAYWRQNLAHGYHGGGSVAGPVSLANEAVRVVLRMLGGQGPKVNDIIWPQPVVTSGNLSQFVQPGWTLTTQGGAENPPGTYLTDQQLNALFNHPGRAPAG